MNKGTKQIFHTSQEVTRFASTANVRSKLLEVLTPEGTTYTFANPFYLVQKLVDSAGAQIPPNSKIFILKLRPAESWETLFAEIPYANYYDLTESQQRSAEYAASILNQAEFDNMVNPQGHKLVVYIESPVAVDLTRPETRFQINAYENN